MLEMTECLKGWVSTTRINELRKSGVFPNHQFIDEAVELLEDTNAA